MASPLVVASREELIFLLCEASELEHLLMCEYLFAAFSMKQGLDEGLTSEQLEAVRRWDRAVSQVAVQEMLHLAQASNLLTALGSMPHFRRPNFPQRSQYYPPHVQLALMPFGEHALRHFIFLERPEGMDGEDAPEFVPLAPEFAAATGDELVPVPQNFATVGQLYRAIEAGLSLLVERYGEEGVFVGPRKAQATGTYFHWPELVAVTDLASARKGIEFVVEQGEGARGDWQNAHYGKFLRVLDEYLSMREAHPGFEPARAVHPARCRRPSDVRDDDDAVLIDDPRTMAVSDLFNACYEVVLEILMRFFLHEESHGDLSTLANTAVDAMFVLIAPLGRLLTSLPVGTSAPGMMAGPSFDIFRASYILPHHRAAWRVLHERLSELASGCHRVRSLFTAPGDAIAAATLAGVESRLRTMATAFNRYAIATPSRDEAL